MLEQCIDGLYFILYIVLLNFRLAKEFIYLYL